jgi:hypothetical protein
MNMCRILTFHKQLVHDLIEISYLTKWAVVVLYLQMQLTSRKGEEVLYIGTLPLHCALPKAVKLHAGINEKSGANFSLRAEMPVSKFTVSCLDRSLNLPRLPALHVVLQDQLVLHKL